jgi:membrane protein
MRLPSRLTLVLATSLAGLGLLSARVRKPQLPAIAAVDGDDATIAGWRSEITGTVHTPRPRNVWAIASRHAWGVAKRVFTNISEHRLMTEAAGVTFYALLALFPALTAVISLYGLFASPNTVSQEVGAASAMLPGGGMDLIQAQLKNVMAANNGVLSFGALLGPLIALWSANSGTKSLFDALNVVYGEKETRSYLRRTLVSMALTVGALIFLVIAMSAVVALPIVLDDLGLSAISALLLQVLRWPLLLVVISLLLDVLFRFGPCRREARWRWVTWGSALSSLLWLLISAGFSWYVANFNSYNRTYGSLGAVIGFMTWIWISSIVVLTGAEVDAALQDAEDSETQP